MQNYLVMGYAEYSNFDFNGLDLFIPLPGCTIFISHKLELSIASLHSLLASYYSMLVQIFIYYKFCSKVHSTTINSLHEIRK